jgi:hypothetical protein
MASVLALAAAEFDVFLTSDRNLSHQLYVGKCSITEVRRGPRA